MVRIGFSKTHTLGTINLTYQPLQHRTLPQAPAGRAHLKARLFQRAWRIFIPPLL